MMNEREINCVIEGGVYYMVLSTGRTKVMTKSSSGANRTFARDAVKIEKVSVRAWNIQVGGARRALDYALADAFMEEMAEFGRTVRPGALYEALKSVR